MTTTLSILLSYSLQLDVYKKECKRLQEEQEGKRRDIKRHPSIDRSKSYPETSSLSYKEDSLDPMSSIALPPSMCSKREGYLNLRDFRHEQLKRVSFDTSGWSLVFKGAVDYNICVVRYNYSYFKNM
jgi:hypothetical protein